MNPKNREESIDIIDKYLSMSLHGCLTEYTELYNNFSFYIDKREDNQSGIFIYIRYTHNISIPPKSIVLENVIELSEKELNDYNTTASLFDYMEYEITEIISKLKKEIEKL